MKSAAQGRILFFKRILTCATLTQQQSCLPWTHPPHTCFLLFKPMWCVLLVIKKPKWTDGIQHWKEENFSDHWQCSLWSIRCCLFSNAWSSVCTLWWQIFLKSCCLEVRNWRHESLVCPSWVVWLRKCSFTSASDCSLWCLLLLKTLFSWWSIIETLRSFCKLEVINHRERDPFVSVQHRVFNLSDRLTLWPRCQQVWFCHLLAKDWEEANPEN